MITKTPPEIRFWNKVQKGNPEECWPWLGEKACQGYGRFSPLPVRGSKKGARKMAHRFAWELINGPIPDGLECCHSCDNRPCCNPSHLYLGTHKQNMGDMSKRGRAFHARGELHPEHKLSEKKVVQIRTMYRPGVVSLNMLSKLFGVSQRLILLVIQRKAWRHVP